MAEFLTSDFVMAEWFRSSQEFCKRVNEEMLWGADQLFKPPERRFIAFLRRYGWGAFGVSDVSARTAERGDGHEWDEPVYLPYADIQGYRNPRDEW